MNITNRGIQIKFNVDPPPSGPNKLAKSPEEIGLRNVLFICLETGLTIVPAIVSIVVGTSIS